ncbi:FecR family protein [Negadavirga shengliensis]|uniref:FecR family protein n=1 Tax=Negadavirga shengliensis TaxID=1389218 RepID=A0ABV9SX75_9BACT
MSKSEYTVEDFILDPEFQSWVLSPDEEAKAYWEGFLEKNPDKYKEVELARKTLLNLSRDVAEVSEKRIEDTWSHISKAISDRGKKSAERRVVPLSSESTIRRYAKASRSSYQRDHQFYRIAAILILAFILGLLFNLTQQHHEEFKEVIVEYEEHVAPPGVKSNLTLQDGSKVILNSGSKLRYVRNFESDKRELYLVGEAYFEVAKDSLRPFIVRTGPIATTALGTSFNITAYENESHDIALLSGKVKVVLDFEEKQQVELNPGEALQVEVEKRIHKKHDFQEEKVLAWTRKTILFDQTPMEEAIRVLENWYGVKIEVLNKPDRGVLLSGRFVDQTLKRVLEGLSYSTRFDFQIAKDQVTLKFDSSS